VTVPYERRPVLVVGGFGYLGLHLADALLTAGADVTVVTPDRTRHEAAASAVERRGARIVSADVRDAAAMGRAVRGQSIVFNLSGRSGAARSVAEPAEDLDVNCGGALALLEAMRAHAPEAKIVAAGSRLVYGSASALPVPEDQALAPICPHGAHKALVERYFTLYRELHGIRATMLRITNPYGPGQPSGRRAYGVINFLIQQAMANGPLPIFGDGRQRRDYVFVDDTIDALLLAGAHPASDGRTYNVGSGVGIAFVDAARTIIDVVGAGHIEFCEWPPVDRAVETGDFVADIRRIKEELGWTPKTAFVDGLRRMIQTSMAEARLP
jgi:nucleoside-diphosphate-sugar epimerase